MRLSILVLSLPALILPGIDAGTDGGKKSCENGIKFKSEDEKAVFVDFVQGKRTSNGPQAYVRESLNNVLTCSLFEENGECFLKDFKTNDDLSQFWNRDKLVQVDDKWLEDIYALNIFETTKNDFYVSDPKFRGGGRVLVGYVRVLDGVNLNAMKKNYLIDDSKKKYLVQGRWGAKYCHLHDKYKGIYLETTLPFDETTYADFVKARQTALTCSLDIQTDGRCFLQNCETKVLSEELGASYPLRLYQETKRTFLGKRQKGMNFYISNTVVDNDVLVGYVRLDKKDEDKLNGMKTKTYLMAGVADRKRKYVISKR